MGHGCIVDTCKHHRSEALPPGERLAKALETLKAHGLRITRPRRALIDALLATATPRSAEELRERIGKGEDLVTVYRNLDAFERAGLVLRAHAESGKALYHLSADHCHYHLVICRVCHEAKVIEDCDGDRFERLAREQGYSDVTHVLELHGVCAKCGGDPTGAESNAAKTKAGG